MAGRSGDAGDADRSGRVIWTVGHSTHPKDEFVEILARHGIEAVADVRRYPGSRRHPHFSPGPLAGSLGGAGIEYVPFPELGGRRTPRPDSPHVAWRNAAFRGYADYMDTPEFERALAQLTELAGRERVAVMCSEAVWWRCHRALIADRLKADGWTVLHITGRGEPREHPYTAVARVSDGRLEY